MYCYMPTEKNGTIKIIQRNVLTKEKSTKRKQKDIDGLNTPNEEGELGRLSLKKQTKKQTLPTIRAGQKRLTTDLGLLSFERPAFNVGLWELGNLDLRRVLITSSGKSSSLCLTCLYKQGGLC